MRKFYLQMFGNVAPTTVTSNLVTPLNTTAQNTTTADMSVTMKDYYDTSLLENAREQMIFTQAGTKVPMKGNTVEWRKFNTFEKALTPLVEGIIPTGKSFGMTKITATTTQHGDYTAVTDRLELEAFDDVIYGATEEMGAASGETFDTLTRNIISAGNSVAYAPKSNGTAVTSVANIDETCLLTPALVNKAATWLKKNKAPKYDGNTYLCFIHPSVAEDLRNSSDWKEFHKYADVAPIFNGEIGTLHGVRFVESNNVKVTETASASGKVYYSLLFMGKGAFGVLDPQGEGMEMIIKDRSQAGGPLNQFSTIGYKFCHGAKILYQERLLRMEVGSSYSAIDSAN